MTIPTEKTHALELDAQDELSNFRQRFVISDPDLIYMDGNSLGRLPKRTAELAQRIVYNEWGEKLISGWGERWLHAPDRVGEKIANLLGAEPEEVIVADSTSVNLFKLVVAALRMQTGKKKLITDNLNFPSDIYILQGVIELLGNRHHLEILSSPNGIHGPEQEIIDSLDTDTSILTLSHTTFKSSYTYDLPMMTQAAHKKGALVLWDLSHSVGALPIDLKVANVDLAVGCTYKYLNGGPGAPAFLYIRRDLHEQLLNPITGWMGHKNMFGFDLDYQRFDTLRSFLTGTPPVLSLSLIEPGVDMLLEAGMDKVRAKSVQQTEYLIDLWDALLKDLGFSLNTPRDPNKRGSHVSIGHEEGLRIDLALINEMNVIPDFRAPDNIRLGIAPLYTSFSDILETVTRLKKIVTEDLFKKYSHETPTVT